MSRDYLALSLIKSTCQVSITELEEERGKAVKIEHATATKR